MVVLNLCTNEMKKKITICGMLIFMIDNSELMAMSWAYGSGDNFS